MSRSDSSRLSARRPQRLVACLVVAVVAAFTVTGLTSTALAATPQNGGVYQIQFKHSGKCLNKPNLWTDDGVQVEQYDCLDWATTERWRLELVPCGEGCRPYYLIRNMQSNKCLNIWLASRDDGAEVVQYTCGAQWSNEVFALDPNTDWDRTSDSRYYRIRSLHSGKCLNVEGASFANGAPIIQYECSGYFPQGTTNMQVRFLQA